MRRLRFALIPHLLNNVAQFFVRKHKICRYPNEPLRGTLIGNAGNDPSPIKLKDSDFVEMLLLDELPE
jgi:hypothetical protein